MKGSLSLPPRPYPEFILRRVAPRIFEAPFPRNLRNLVAPLHCPCQLLELPFQALDEAQSLAIGMVALSKRYTLSASKEIYMVRLSLPLCVPLPLQARPLLLALELQLLFVQVSQEVINEGRSPGLVAHCYAEEVEHPCRCIGVMASPWFHLLRKALGDLQALPTTPSLLFNIACVRLCDLVELLLWCEGREPKYNKEAFATHR